MDWIKPPADLAPPAPLLLIQGFVLVPRIAPPSSPQDATRPSAPLSLTLRAESAADGRAQVLAEAARRGISAPHVRAEAFVDGMYVGVVEPGGGEPTGIGSRPGDAAIPARQRRPSWILVLPVDAAAPGRPAWGSGVPWSRAWIAPVRRGGTRVVAITGDADDRERVPDALLDSPDSGGANAAMAGMARKYGAPASAIVRQEGTHIRVWLWHGGGDPQFAEGEAGEDAHATGLALLLELAGVEPAGDARQAPDAAAPAAPAEPPEVDIEAHPEYLSERGQGYAVVLSSHDPAAAEMVRRVVAALPGVTLGRVVVDVDGADIALTFPGDRATLATALRGAGLRIAP